MDWMISSLGTPAQSGVSQSPTRIPSQQELSMRIAFLNSQPLGAIVLALAGYLTLPLAARAADDGDDPKAAVVAAAKRLAELPGYSWRSTVIAGDFGPIGGGGGVTTGRTAKGGYTHVSAPSFDGGRLEF